MTDNILWGMVAILGVFVLNQVLGPLIPKNKYVTDEVCKKCQELRCAERDGLQQQLEVMSAELVRLRNAIHDLRNNLSAVLTRSDMRAAGIPIPGETP